MSFKDFELALRGEEHESIPVWFMRQAGRYLPEFRKMRGSNGIKEICKTPKTVAEISITPVNKFGLDAAIIFHDLVLPLEGMGFNFQYLEGKGPVSDKTLMGMMAGTGLIDYAQSIDPYPLGESIKLFLSSNRATPLIGFVGGPLTLLSYIVMNKRDPDLSLTRDFLYTHPLEAKKILKMLTDMVIAFSKAQIEAGITALQIFDSWIGNLPKYMFIDFYEKYLVEIVSELRGRVPLIYFSAGSSHLDDRLVKMGFDFISVDWRHDLPRFAIDTASNIGVQGNLDPALTRVGPEASAKEIARILNGLKGRNDYIFNLGHGVPPDAKLETVAKITEAVHAFKR